MIGVEAPPNDREIAREFFELFKTPWEYYRRDGAYDVVLCTGGNAWEHEARLVIVYSTEPIAFDAHHQIEVKSRRAAGAALYGAEKIPLYTLSATFAGEGFALLKDESGLEPMAVLRKSPTGAILRIGYNLFEEVRFLLTDGQPAANAGCPSLELHIALLRELITRSGLTLFEIPPVPDGHPFIACLTHDLDHPVMRNHWLDHTMAGFLCRATLGSARDVLRRKRSPGTLGQNWAAVANLPLVHLGLAKDPWQAFDRYLELEAGLGATYFVIPRKGYAGRLRGGPARSARASKYTVSEIKPQLERILSAGNEVGLHGIDAWFDGTSAAAEREALRGALGSELTGTRMHWLFFDKASPSGLDEAGFSYDSTLGYNETVGFRAGTAQAYQFAGATRLLELPLHIMDTALFYPAHLNLGDTEAKAVMRELIAQVSRFGGALTINWHDRSIFPERLWRSVYAWLLTELKSLRAWFPTASQAAAWFRKRRSCTFHEAVVEAGRAKLNVTAKGEPGLPGLRVRVHPPKAQSLFSGPISADRANCLDLSFKDSLCTTFALAA
jgi:hypothetical protein